MNGQVVSSNLVKTALVRLKLLVNNDNKDSFLAATPTEEYSVALEDIKLIYVRFGKNPWY